MLRSINLVIGEGEKVVIAGSSGSGKCPLLRCINRLESIDRGTLVVDGMPVHDPKLDVHRLRREISMVFQQCNLFPRQ